MITVTNISWKKATTPDTDTYNADIEPGKSIRIYGTYRNLSKGPKDFDLTFKIGDAAEYHSYNLKYVGTIVKIGPKTVTIKHYEHTSECTRLDLHTFCWRNWDFDAAKIAAHNSEEMNYI